MNARLEKPGASDRFVSFLVDHPWRALLVGLATLMAAMPGAQYVQPDFSYRVWFNDDDPLIQEFDRFERRFGNDETILVVVHSPSGIFDVESAKLLQDLTEALWQTPEAIRVDSLSNFNWTHAEEDDLMVEPLLPTDLELTPELLAERKAVAQKHESIPGYLMSKDATAALVMVSLKPALDANTDYMTVTAGVKEILAKFEGKGDHEFFLTGGPPLSDAFRDASQKDMGTMLPLTFLLTILFLFGTFRRLTGMILPIVVILTSIVAAFGLIGWLGFSMNNMTAIMPQCLLAICVADSVHILVSYFQARARGLDKKEAARYSLRKNLLPTIMTSVTTAAGFFSFATAAVVPIAQFGLVTGLGTLVAWILTYFLIGPAIALIPMRQPVGDEVKLTEASPRSEAIASWFERNRIAILATFGVLTVGAAFLAARLDVNSDPFKYFQEEDPLNKAQVFLEEKVGGGLTIETAVECGEPECMKDPEFLGKVDRFQTWLETLPYVSNSTSIVDILKATNRSLHGDEQEHYRLPDTREGIAQQYLLYTLSLPAGMDLNNRVTLSNDAIRITSMWTIHDSKTVLKEIEQVESKAKELGLSAYITGKAQLWQSMNPKVVDTFVTSLSWALVMMSFLMIFAFRSWKLGLLSMIPNTVPLVLGAAVIRLLGRDLDIATVIIFSVCLGIAVDDTIHFLANYNRLRGEGHPPREAIARIFTHTMPALVVTTVVLVAAFGVFAFASFVPNMWFGILVAVILTIGLVTDAILLPALLLVRRDARLEREPSTPPVEAAAA